MAFTVPSMMGCSVDMHARRTDLALADLAAIVVMLMIAFRAQNHVGADDARTAFLAYLVSHSINLAFWRLPMI